MIYLIAGSPRLGKSTIARQLAKTINAQLVSTDELEKQGAEQPSVVFYNDAQKNTLLPLQRIELVKNEAEQIISKIDSVISSSINNSQDIVIEGVHLFPGYVDKIIKKFEEENIKVLFLMSTNIKLILDGMVKNTSPNNWLKEFDKEVLEQVALFTKVFSNYLYLECKKYNLPYMERSNDFQKDILDVINELK